MRIILFATAAALLISLASPSSAFAGPAVHLGEDGIEYRLAEPGIAELESIGWRYGKIEPALHDKTLTDLHLDVIVYIARQEPQEDVATPRSVGDRHRPAIDALRDQISEIYDRYDTVVPLREHEEKEHALHVERIITAADRDRLNTLHRELDDVLTVMKREVAAAFEAAGAERRAEMAALITAMGGQVYATIPISNALAARLPSVALDALALNPLVMRVVADRPVQYELDVSIPSVSYDVWWPAYDGGVWDFGIVDSGVRTDHPAFSPFTFYSPAGSTIYNDHGTHVAGIVLSDHATYRGGAYGLDAVIWANRGNLADTLLSQAVTMDNMHWMMSSPAQQPEVVNHSLGYGTADGGDYSDNDSFYDAFIDHFDVLVTKSAGNGGWNSTDPTITHPATAYNLIAVGSMDDRDTEARGDDIRAFDTSVGPTVSDRKKPDLSAPGEDIWSTNTEWNGSTGIDILCPATAGADFKECSGTSMAAPHVAAAVLLMQDAGNTSPMSQKAVLINSADAWTSNDTSSAADDGPVAGSHWDKVYGWGYIDMGETYLNRGDYVIDSVVARNDTATPDDYKLYRGTLYADEKITMVWHKRADNYVDGDPSTGRRSLSDLNMRLYRESDGVEIDSDLDGNDNVHQVSTSSTATVVVKPYAWSESIDGASSEEFALALEEDFYEVTPPDFRRAYNRPNYVGPDQTFDVTVRIYNDGDVTAHNVDVDVDNVPGVSGFTPTNYGSIPGASDYEDRVFSITTNGVGAGTVWLPIDVSSNSYLETYDYEKSDGVSLIVETTPPVGNCTSAPAYSNDDSIQIDWTASDTQTGVDETYLYVYPAFGSGWVWSGLKASGTSGTYDFDMGQDGPYVFAVRSRDVGGTWEDFPVASECDTFQDTVTPSHTLSSPSLDTSGSIPLTYSSTDPSPSSGISRLFFYYHRIGDAGGWNVVGTSLVSSGVFNWTPGSGDGKYHFVAVASDRAGNTESLPPVPSGDTATVYDTLPPEGSITIAGGAATTTSLLVNLSTPASDEGAGVAEMRLSNDGVHWASPVPYSPTVVNWNLGDPATGGNSTAGLKSVFVQYRDGALRQTPSYSDTIEYIVDADGDGISDNADNCLTVSNSAQRDTDADNLGNYCDPDIAPAANDCSVNFADLAALKQAFLSTPGDANWNQDADFDGNNSVSFSDVAIMKSFFLTAPGPSGLPNDCD